MDTEELVRRFEAGEAPEGGFHHAQHVQVAWHYLWQSPLPLALERFADALKHFAAAQRAPTLYHETITTAYILIINERLDRAAEPDWSRFAAENPDLLTWKPSVLDRYYTPETLWSDRAKQTFVKPDRLSLGSAP